MGAIRPRPHDAELTVIHPFCALRPTARAGHPQDLVTLPYDKITTESLPALRARSPYCAVHLIRGESGPEDRTWYAEARRKLDAWVNGGLFAPDPTPGYYALRQEWAGADGSRVVRTAIVGALDLAQRGRVLPHEKTHARAREDRYALLRATEHHFGLVFLLRPGRRGLAAHLAQARPLGSVLGLENADHHAFRIDAEDSVAEIRSILAEGEYVIADGHHRFATACRFADEHPRARRVLVGVVEESDPGLSILPTHRLLSGIGRDLPRALLSRLPGAVPVDLGPDPARFIAERGPGNLGIMLASGERYWLQNPLAKEPGAEGLDVRRLEELVIGPLLAGKEVEDHLSYWRDPAPALAQLRAGQADLLALVAPLPGSKVIEVARRREVMPQKSTDFYPKLPTGFGYLPALE